MYRDRAMRSICIAATAFVVAVGVACDGCSTGCATEVDVEASIEPAAPLADDVVAVARLMNFDRRHFDVQHWLAEGVEAGAFSGREDLEHGIPVNRLTEVRELYEGLFEEQAERILWNEHLDIAVWRPADDDGDWRWTMSIPAEEGRTLGRVVDWTVEGGGRVGGDSESAVPVFRRQNDAGEALFVAEVPTPETAGGSHGETALTVSNFAPGATGIAQAVSLTGESGHREAELYLWPRRLGVDQRYRSLGQVVDQKLARRGHDTQSPLVGLTRLKVQLLYQLGEPKTWPEVVRVSKDVDRDEETGGAEYVEFSIDVSTEDVDWLTQLHDAMKAGDFRRQSPIDGAAAQFDIEVGDETVAALMEALIPRRWFSTVTAHDEVELEDRRLEFEAMIDEVESPATIAVFESPLPMGLSGETYLSFETEAPDELSERAGRFHREWFIEEYWLPLIGLPGEAFEESEQREVDGRETDFDHDAFVIGHGFGLGGVCRMTSGDRYHTYYGVDPCERLHGIVDGSSWEDAASPVSYRGVLQGLVDRLLAVPGQASAELFEDVDLEWRIEGTSDAHLRLTTGFDDLVVLGRIVEGIPRLRHQWSPEELAEVGQMRYELPLDVAVYQEPTLSILGVPGLGGPPTNAQTLGMPFSYPPAPPESYRRLFFADPDDDRDHSHSHSHGHDHDHGGHAH